jgi:hypothetical protein
MEENEPILPPEQEPENSELEPEPRREATPWISPGVLGWLAVAGGATFLAISATSQRTMGATRSMKLEWQQRQAVIEQAVRAEAAEADQVTEPADDASGSMPLDAQ